MLLRRDGACGEFSADGLRLCGGEDKDGLPGAEVLRKTPRSVSGHHEEEHRRIQKQLLEALVRNYWLGTISISNCASTTSSSASSLTFIVIIIVIFIVVVFVIVVVIIIVIIVFTIGRLRQRHCRSPSTMSSSL